MALDDTFHAQITSPLIASIRFHRGLNVGATEFEANLVLYTRSNTSLISRLRIQIRPSLLAGFGLRANIVQSSSDFNGYGYFYGCLSWTGFGLQANIAEKYVLFKRRVARGCCTEENSC